MRVGLVGCVKTKLDHAAPAGELYTSPLFRYRKAYVERTCDRWYVLSAKHGLMEPSVVTKPYEQTLVGAPAAVKKAWATKVLADLEAEVELAGAVVEVHAGKDYMDHGLRAGLIAVGAEVVEPTAGLRMGQQLAFYRNGA